MKHLVLLLLMVMLAWVSPALEVLGLNSTDAHPYDQEAYDQESIDPETAGRPGFPRPLTEENCLEILCWPSPRDIGSENLTEHFSALYPKRSVELTISGKDNVEQKGTGSLDVKLHLVQDTRVQAKLTNNGTVDLKVLKVNNLLDPLPVKKVHMYRGLYGNGPLEFAGFSAYYARNWTKKDWITIGTGKEISVEFDLAQLYDLSDGGLFRVMVHDTYRIGWAGSGLQEGASVGVVSPHMEIFVNGTKASEVHSAQLAHIQAIAPGTGTQIDENTCMPFQQERISEALIHVKISAQQAADDALVYGWSIQSRFWQYYHSILRRDRCIVAANFMAIAAVADQVRESESAVIHCIDAFVLCDALSLVAYNWEADKNIYLCPRAWSLPTATVHCHRHDLAGTILHEIGHSRHVIRPHLEDVPGGDGWPDCKWLSRRDSMQNADTYAYYAQSVEIPCLPLIDTY